MTRHDPASWRHAQMNADRALRGLDHVPFDPVVHGRVEIIEEDPFADVPPAGLPIDEPVALMPSTLPLTIADWRERELPEPDFLLGSWLSTTNRVLLPAATGLGKSNFTMAIGFAVADGVDFLHWAGRRKARVLYIDGEMSRRLLKRRIQDAAARHGSDPAGFLALSHEDVPNFRPLNTPDGQAALLQLIERLKPIDLLIADNIMSLTVGDPKETTPWAATMPLVLRLTSMAIGQMWVHHTGHDESRSYGDKSKEWSLDTVAFMEKVERPDTDISFALEFRKARERTPETRPDFQKVRVALVGDRWVHEATDAGRPQHVSPLGAKFELAIKNVLAGADVTVINGRKAARYDDWMREAISLGLVDPKSTERNQRALLNKYRRELAAANRIASQDDLSWTL